MTHNVHRLPIVTPAPIALGAGRASSAGLAVVRPAVVGPSAPAVVRGAEPATSGELLQVGDLARICGKTVRAIHHYEQLGLLQPHKRSHGGYRLYAPEAVARVRWVGKLSDMGMTLGQVQEILALWEKAPSAPEAMGEIRAVYHQKLEEVQEQISRLSALERELSASLAYLSTCETCDPNELVAACCCCTVHDPEVHEPELVAGLHASAAVAG